MLPAIQVSPTYVQSYYGQFQEKKPEPEPDFDDYHSYTVIDPKTIKDKILSYLGAVLARCWIDSRLMKQLEQDPHGLLLEMGLILPEDLKLVVHQERKNRPRITIYENKKRICSLQLSMIASR
jgi:hypothetical protein